MLRRTIAAVVAHPDDESYAFAGTLAKVVAGGGTAYVVSATRGEGGRDWTGQGRRGASLAGARSEELAASCRAFGAHPPWFLELPDGSLAAREAEGIERLEAVLEELDPDVVLTLGLDGAYGHVDHLAVTRMVASAAATRRVLHAVFPPRAFAPFFRQMRGLAPKLLGPVDEASLGSPHADLVVDISGVRDRKLASIAAHESQLPGGEPRRFLSTGLVDQLLDQERYRLASGLPLPTGAADPFEGL